MEIEKRCLISFSVKYDMSIRHRVNLNDRNVMTDICHNIVNLITLSTYVSQAVMVKKW